MIVLTRLAHPSLLCIFWRLLSKHLLITSKTNQLWCCWSEQVHSAGVLEGSAKRWHAQSDMEIILDSRKEEIVDRIVTFECIFFFLVLSSNILSNFDKFIICKQVRHKSRGQDIVYILQKLFEQNIVFWENKDRLFSSLTSESSNVHTWS